MNLIAVIVLSDPFVCYVIDTETTNLDTKIGDVIEISAIRLIFYNQDRIEQEQKTWYLKALNKDGIQDEALKINGHSKSDILHLTQAGREKYKDPSEIVSEIELWVMEDNVSAIDRVFVGQNPQFDIEALQNTWKKVNSENSFPFDLAKGRRTLDTLQIVTLFDLCIGKRRKYYNLSNLVKSFGVKKGKAHIASEDTRMTSDLLIKLIIPIVQVIRDNFSNCYDGDN